MIRELDKISIVLLSNILTSLPNTRKFIYLVYAKGNKINQSSVILSILSLPNKDNPLKVISHA